MSGDGMDRRVYRVLHAAYKTEYVVASSPEEARENTAGGWSCGDYAYGETPDLPNPLCHVKELQEMPLVGEKTVQRLLDADSPVPLGPASDTDVLRQADVTRLRNQLEDPSNTGDMR